MLTWGEIRIGYYLGIIALVWFFNGQASAIFLGILIALFLERDFKAFVLGRYGEKVAPDDRATAQAISAAQAEAKSRMKANNAADKKPAAKAKTPRKTTKPKPAAGD